jgi:hypothetical protein
MNLRLGARPFAAYTRWQYASMLLAGGDPSARPKALGLLSLHEEFHRDAARLRGVQGHDSGTVVLTLRVYRIQKFSHRHGKYFMGLVVLGLSGLLHKLLER